MMLDSLKKQALVLLVFVILITAPAILGYCYTELQNHAPVVKILKPKNNTRIRWKKSIRYEVKVSDQEDGKSKFHEIPSNEVFLKVTYLQNVSDANQREYQVAKVDSLGLTVIKQSNCLNCHRFRAKSIGPSFTTINHHYENTEENKKSLRQHIKEGSSGTWGQATMPSHMELKDKELENIVHWIMNRAGDPKISYYIGTKGAFNIRKPGKSGSRAGLRLSASYTDHGTKEHPHKTLYGHDTIIIYAKK